MSVEDMQGIAAWVIGLWLLIAAIVGPPIAVVWSIWVLRHPPEDCE